MHDSDISQEMIDEAKRNPDGWIYKIDCKYRACNSEEKGLHYDSFRRPKMAILALNVPAVRDTLT